MKTDSPRIVALRAAGWLTVAERARADGVSPGTIHRWLRGGSIERAQKVGGLWLFEPRPIDRARP